MQSIIHPDIAKDKYYHYIVYWKLIWINILLFQNKNFMCYAIPETVDYSRVICPVAESACNTDAVWILQNGMLGEREDMEGFVQAVLKIQEGCHW